MRNFKLKANLINIIETLQTWSGSRMEITILQILPFWQIWNYLRPKKQPSRWLTQDSNSVTVLTDQKGTGGRRSKQCHWTRTCCSRLQGRTIIWTQIMFTWNGRLDLRNRNWLPRNSGMRRWIISKNWRRWRWRRWRWKESRERINWTKSRRRTRRKFERRNVRTVRSEQRPHPRFWVMLGMWFRRRRCSHRRTERSLRRSRESGRCMRISRRHSREWRSSCVRRSWRRLRRGKVGAWRIIMIWCRRRGVLQQRRVFRLSRSRRMLGSIRRWGMKRRRLNFWWRKRSIDSVWRIMRIFRKRWKLRNTHLTWTTYKLFKRISSP